MSGNCVYICLYFLFTSGFYFYLSLIYGRKMTFLYYVARLRLVFTIVHNFFVFLVFDIQEIVDMMQM
jgi:hypothetical protein